MKRRAEEFPFRAVGGNVLLRKIATHSRLILFGYEGPKHQPVHQIGEVIGLGSRWTQDRAWFPPMPNQDKARMARLGGPGSPDMHDPDWKPAWKTPDSRTVRTPMAAFTPMHAERATEIQVGDLVVYATPRVYDMFTWHDEVILVYPGNWLVGHVTHAHLVDHPEERPYDSVHV